MSAPTKSIESATEPSVGARFALRAEERQRADEARMAWLNLKEAEERVQRAKRRAKRLRSIVHAVTR